MQYQNINYIITVEITLHKLKYYRQAYSQFKWNFNGLVLVMIFEIRHMYLELFKLTFGFESI